MKRSRQTLANDRLTDAALAVLKVIKEKKEIGISKNEIKWHSKLPITEVKKSLAALIRKELIKEVPNIQRKGTKHYMAAEFEPSKEITGGEWYLDGALHKEFIEILKQICLRFVNLQKVVTIDLMYEYMQRKQTVVKEWTKQQIDEIMNMLVLGNEILEVKSTGLGEYHGIPIGDKCYRIADNVGKGGFNKIGAMASIPCGMCPRINLCTPHGLINPISCVYMNKWMEF